LADWIDHAHSGLSLEKLQPEEANVIYPGEKMACCMWHMWQVVDEDEVSEVNLIIYCGIVAASWS